MTFVPFSQLDADTYLKHKDYFDSRLIMLVDQQKKKICQLNEKNAKNAMRIATSQETIKALKYTIRCQKSEIQMLFKESKKKDRTIRDLEKELDELSRTVDGELQDSYERNHELEKENIELEKENERLKKELEILRKRMNLNSTNSSKPSSTDGFFRRPKNMRETTNRKIGGQKGHRAHLSHFSENPVKIIEKHVKEAPTGAVAVKDENNHIQYYRTQEINVNLKVEIYETRYFVDETNEELSNDEMKRYKINCVSYNPHFIAMVLYLNNKGYIALERLCEMLKEMSDGDISLRPSTICKWMKKFGQKSEDENSRILHDILEYPIKHVDETGLKTNGENTWMHVITNAKGAYFIATEKRVDRENGPIRIMEDVEGIIVHDHLKSYYDLDCLHAECNAHVLRYLKSGMEEDETSYAEQMSNLLKSMLCEKKELEFIGEGKINEETADAYEREYLKIAEEGIKKFEEKNPGIEARYVPEYIKLFKRMIKYKDEHLLFIRDFRVPFDNNAAERQMRIVKTKKKVSGQFKNIENENNFASMLTIMQSCKINKINTLKAIEDILKA